MRFGIVRPSSTALPPAESSGSDSDHAGPEPLNAEDISKIQEQLGYQFKDTVWLERALTHRSVPSRGGGQSDYERLEFLGDAVLDLAVAHLLLEAHPEAREGELSKMRAALVNTASLADIARKINLGPYIRLSRGELANGGAERPSILADVCEALMGAIYREAGFAIALECITKLFGELAKTVTPRDPKTELQEALHASGSTAPDYLLECVEGPEHAPVFVSIVKVDGQIVGRGRGPTKKASQQAAASEALEALKPGDAIDQAFLGDTEMTKSQETKDG